jgi:two-component system, OmpR family, KDP operon response regulator KdpE
MSRVLVADDDAAIRKVVRDALERAGHEIETAADGEEALARFEGGAFDLVVADWNMPVLDGFELVRRLRKSSAVPILMLTVRSEERDKVRLLDAGADDYVTKPFGVAELVARAAALLRRTEHRTAPRPARFGDVDPESRTVRKHGRIVHLTPIEYSLLTALLSKPGTVWTHRQLMAAVWGTTAGVTTDTLRVHMGSLRRKLETDPNRPRFLRTEPWVGYRFTPDSADGKTASTRRDPSASE